MKQPHALLKKFYNLLHIIMGLAGSLSGGPAGR